MGILNKLLEKKKEMSLGLLAILILIGAYFLFRDPYIQVEPGNISGDSLKEKALYTAGEFTLEIATGEEGPQLIVRNLADPDHIVMASIPEKSLAGPGRANMAIHESRGSFTVEEDFEEVCTDQIIESV